MIHAPSAGTVIGLALMIAVSLLALAPQASERLVVVAVTHPSLAVVVEAIGGSKVRVLTLVPPGIDPHHYEVPTSTLISLLEEVDIVLMTGPSHLPLEERIEGLYRSGLVNWVLVTYREYLNEGLELLTNPATGQLNPHGYFYSIRGLKAIARAIFKALATVDPADSDYYRDRLVNFLSYLVRLEETLSSISGGAPRASRVALITPILQYAAIEAGLKVEYLAIPEHDVPVDARSIYEAASRYEKVYEVLIVSDEELYRYQQELSELTRLGVPIVTVPLTTLSQRSPELIPLAIGLALSSPQVTPRTEAHNPTPYLLVITLLSGLLVTAGVYILWARSYVPRRYRAG